MRWSFPVGKVFGIPIRVHYTFLLLLAFIWYAESSIYGPQTGLNSVILWLLIFLCVLLHELGHSRVAQSYGLNIVSIVLLPIGGVSQITDIPKDPIKEVNITIAGPIVNFVIAGLLFAVGKLLDPSLAFSQISLQSGNILVDLFWANVMLGVFNIIPAYPMDGGRILRGILAMKRDYVEATRLAADVGKLFAIGFIVFGLFYNWWLILIGIFVFSGATSEMATTVITTSLEKLIVSDLMVTDFKTISPEEPMTAVVEKSLHTFQHDFPVVSDGKFVGVLTRSAVIESLHNRLHETKVGEIAKTSFPTISPDETAAEALTAMRTAHVTVAPVEKDGKLLGIITTEKLLEASDVFNEKGK
ncbi:MAG: site-2 protease family protein [Bacteroidetes bacterium]|nr:site-2 protease family protein [Bacteroidota bacterium]MCL5737999.1 site-2 protease family protein [Bacteroidota bacterium]